MSIYEQCVFCPSNRFRNNYLNGFSKDESLIFEDDNIFITPDLSPLVPGHLLVVSHTHYNSFANSTNEVKESLFKALKHIEASLGYTKMTWFEHGAVFPGEGGASVDHAHLHVIPDHIDLQSRVEQDNLFSESHYYSDNLFNSLAGKQPYLWISGTNNTSKIYYVGKLSSQYLRMLVMDMYGSSNYDWKNSYSQERNIIKYRESLEFINSMRKNDNEEHY